MFRNDALARLLASFFLYYIALPRYTALSFRTLRLSSHFPSPSFLFSLRFFIVFILVVPFLFFSLALDILIARLPRYFRESQIYGPAPQWIALTTYSYTYIGMYDRVPARNSTRERETRTKERESMKKFKERMKEREREIGGKVMET